MTTRTTTQRHSMNPWVFNGVVLKMLVSREKQFE